ncbi:DUF362 domain-containing protein [Patescibacteria group bacterium]|nr:DUF362 domain-containing protein [Patescibacteria group bacterium]
MNEALVYIDKSTCYDYPKSPFNPPRRYPELSQLDLEIENDPNNEVYDQVRTVLMELGLDKENQGTKHWRPFKDLIKPGQHAILKPNFVKGKHPLGEIGSQSMITHASLMRPIIDYLLISTNGNCEITICDVPLQSSVWSEILKHSQTDKLVKFYKSKNVKINLLDLRREISHFNKEMVIDKRDFADRDPRGYAIVDMGNKSALMPVIKEYKKFMITDYDKGTVSSRHNEEKNEYYICKTILDADLFINLPKLKTHRKAGLTVAGKNLIGMNGDKRWIAHHREGSLKFGGDEFPRYKLKDWFEFRLFSFLKRHDTWGVWLATKIRKYHRMAYNIKNHIKQRWLKKKQPADKSENSRKGEENEYFVSFAEFKEQFPNASLQVYEELNPKRPRYLEGSWYGNDTIWRTISDLNYIIFYADKEGKLQESPQRNYFCLVDGILAGDKEGPMEHTPKKAGVILGGFHPLAIDFASAWIMGFDYQKIPAIREILKNPKVNFPGLSHKNIQIKSNVDIERTNLKFRPTINWYRHIER